MILKKSIKAIICAAALIFAGSAAAQHQVKFSVTDSVSAPESFATVRIFMMPDTVKPVKLSTTDVDGKFSEKVDTTGDYRISISSLGKTTHFLNTRIDRDVNLGTIILRASSTVLEAVDVVAQRPLVTTEIDRFVYDMKADDESKTNNIFDMLKKVPMVTVDGEDNIKVKGQSNFRIFKNGRPNSQWEKNPKEVLKSIPASMIKRVEVITEPGAKYDAEGVDGILNIVTDEGVTAKGIMGSVSAHATERGTTGLWGYATAQYDKLVFSANLGFNYDPKHGSLSKRYSETDYTLSGDKFITEEGADDRSNEGQYYNFGLKQVMKLTLSILSL
ncbi:MAG: TonB-dependent receptor plug domain-containing protein, partial [Muribaculaceae bacterium]|nr:TonB-dependent receptor plug domain-containing protein [Muribaculaceae bacterium]